MVGQGTLRECLLADDVESVLTIGRTFTGQQHPKLQEIVQSDLFDLTPIEAASPTLTHAFFVSAYLPQE
jgi:hypothetical protein